METLKETRHNEFIEYFQIFHYNYIIKLVTAILVTATTIRIWKLFRTMKIFRIMESTILFSVKPLLALLVFKLIFLTLFTFTGYILYCEKSKYFRTPSEAFLTYLLISINLHQHIDHDLFASKIDYILHTFFMIFTFVIFNLLIATICLNYTKAQQYHSEDTFEYTLKDYIVEQCLYICALLKFNFLFPKHRKYVEKHAIQNENIQAKDGEFRYANSYSMDTNRMDGMVCVSLSIIRNFYKNSPNNLNGKDFELILKTASRLHEDERKFGVEKEIFFDNREIQGRQNMKLVDDKKFQKMETITRYLLGNDEYRDRQLFLYRKIMNAHNEKIQFLNDYLENLSKVIDNIRIK